MKTQIVKFSYGTVKDASLKIPAQAHSIIDIITLIRESYLEYAFRPGCGLMSDEVLTSSIGHSNFFAGALGGWETRLTPEQFTSLKSCADDNLGMAIAIVQFRAAKQGRKMTKKEVYLEAAKNEVLNETYVRFLREMAKSL